MEKSSLVAILVLANAIPALNAHHVPKNAILNNALIVNAIILVNNLVKRVPSHAFGRVLIVELATCLGNYFIFTSVELHVIDSHVTSDVKSCLRVIINVLLSVESPVQQKNFVKSVPLPRSEQCKLI